MIGLVSINHNSANLHVRERFSFTDTEIVEFQELALKKVLFDGIFIISTCNRTEIYFEKEECEQDQTFYKDTLVQALKEFKSFEEDLNPFIISEFNLQVVKHFFSVASGLRSMVFGEYQIVSQIKEAYYVAQSNGMLGPVIEKMIHKALETGKNVRTSTDISKGAVSVSSAAVEISLKKFKKPDKIKVLNIGTGETGQLVIESLKKKGCLDITLANRTYSSAVEFAKIFNAKVIEFHQVNETLEEVDVVVYSTSAKNPLLTLEATQELMKKREHKPLLIIDVGVPRNVDAEVETVKGVDLFNLDRLKVVVQKNNEKKKGKLDAANAIVDSKVKEFEEWLNSNQLKRTFAMINHSFNKVNKIQSLRFKDTPIHSEIKEYGDILSRKYSRMIIKQLRQATKSGINSESLELIEELFAFESM